jgi:serine/threonine protein kinase/predicted Zn-dependent protease
MNPAKPEIDHEHQLEQLIGRFEADWQAADDIRLESYLPDEDSDMFLQTLVELVRIDMELGWDSGRPRRLRDYLKRFPRLANDPQALNDAAFEEYRLRCDNRQGRQSSVDSLVLKQQYAREFGIDVAGWPVWDSVTGHDISTRAEEEDAEASGPFPEVGQQVCGFRLVGLLGQGACGKVFLARQDDLANRLVSLKITTEQSRESGHLARLQHTNIIPVFSVHRVGRLTALCMPFLGMSTIKDLLAVAWNRQAPQDDHCTGQALISTTNQARAQSVLETIRDQDEKRVFEAAVETDPGQRPQAGGRQPWIDLTVDLACGIAEGLGHAHDRDLVHGDIKPANILLSDEGQPVLLDFHLSRRTSHDPSTEWIGGTLPYMSPEQLRSLDSGEAIDTRADIFSFGVLLFQLLTGELPWNDTASGTMAGMIEARQHTPSIRSHAPHLSVDLDSIVGKCLAPRAADRYASADQLLCDLRQHRAHRPLRYAPNCSWRERSWKFLQRHPRLTSAASIAAISLVIVAGLLLLLVNRAQRIATLNAANESRQLIGQLADARLALSVITDDFAGVADALQSTRHLLQEFGAATPQQWTGNSRTSRLSATQRARERQQLGETCFWMAESGRRAARRESSDERVVSLLDEATRHHEMASWFLPDQAGALGLSLQRALLLQARGEDAAAGQLLGELSGKQPDSAMDALLVTALTAASPDSLKVADQLVELDGRNHTAWIVAGNAMIQQGQSPRGIACYQMAASLAPHNSYVQWSLGRARLDAGDFPNALRSFRQVNRLDPENARGWMNTGLVLLELNQPKPADEAFTRAIEEGASDSRVWYLRSQTREMLGQSREAAADFEKFMRLEPADYLGYQTRGEQLVTSRPEAAIDDFQQALELNPASTVAIQNIAHVYSEVLNDLPAATRWVNRLVQQQPENPVFLAYRGILHARQDDRPRAVADAQAALALKSDADTLYRVAGIYAQTGRRDAEDRQQAVRLLAKAAFLNPRLILDYLPIDPDIRPLQTSEEYRLLLDSLKKLEEAGRQSVEKSRAKQ